MGVSRTVSQAPRAQKKVANDDKPTMTRPPAKIASRGWSQGEPGCDARLLTALSPWYRNQAETARATSPSRTEGSVLTRMQQTVGCIDSGVDDRLGLALGHDPSPRAGSLLETTRRLESSGQHPRSLVSRLAGRGRPGRAGLLNCDPFRTPDEPAICHNTVTLEVGRHGGWGTHGLLARSRRAWTARPHRCPTPPRRRPRDACLASRFSRLASRGSSECQAHDKCDTNSPHVTPVRSFDSLGPSNSRAGGPQPVDERELD